MRKALTVVMIGLIPALLLYVFLSSGGTLAALVVVFVVIAALVISLRWPAIGLAAMGTMVSAEVSQNLTFHFGLPSTSQLLVPALTVLFVLRYMFYGAKPFVSGAAWLVVLAQLGWMSLSMVWADYWLIAQNNSYSALKDFAIVVLTMAFVNTPRMMRAWLNAVIVTISLICVLGFYRYLTGSSETFGGFVSMEYVEKRFIGPLSDPNFFGLTLAFLIPICVGRVLHEPGWRAKMFGLVMGGILFAGMMLTQSRGALVAVLVALAVFMALMDRKTQIRALIFVAVSGIVASFALSDQLASRFDFLFTPSSVAPQQDIAVEGRLASWAVAEELFLENPILGVGTGNFNPHFQDMALRKGLIFRGMGRSAHSLYLETLAELGLVGFGLLMTIFTMAFLAPFRAARGLDQLGRRSEANECRALAIGLLAMYVARFFLHDDYPILMWTAIGIAMGLPKVAGLGKSVEGQPVQDYFRRTEA